LTKSKGGGVSSGTGSSGPCGAFTLRIRGFVGAQLHRLQLEQFRTMRTLKLVLHRATMPLLIGLVAGCSPDSVSAPRPNSEPLSPQVVTPARIFADSIVVPGATVTRSAVRLSDGRTLNMAPETERAITEILDLVASAQALDSQVQRRVLQSGVAARLAADPRLRQRAMALADRARSLARSSVDGRVNLDPGTVVPIEYDCIEILGAIYYETLNWREARESLESGLGMVVTPAIVDAILSGDAIDVGISDVVPFVLDALSYAVSYVALNILASYAHAYDCVN
jgi:hypothetical protein